MPVLRRFPVRSAACACVCALLPACADAPTGPDSFVQEAGGSVWVAVAVPEGMPDARSWVPYLAPESPVFLRVRSIQEQAHQARRAGDLEEAAALEAAALREAAHGIAANPPAVKLLNAVAALDRWQERAGERLEAGSFPGLDSVAARVHALRNEARAALVQGDTSTAVVRLSEAAEAAREFAPATVGLRLVTSAEQRIDAEADPSPNLKRARMLLRTAREAMATGDETRAMKRAWYALQLIEAEEARVAGGE
jgi:hypothetical protein